MCTVEKKFCKIFFQLFSYNCEARDRLFWEVFEYYEGCLHKITMQVSVLRTLGPDGCI
jgi:hypothetical protein